MRFHQLTTTGDKTNNIKRDQRKQTIFIETECKHDAANKAAILCTKDTPKQFIAWLSLIFIIKSSITDYVFKDFSELGQCPCATGCKTTVIGMHQVALPFIVKFLNSDKYINRYLTRYLYTTIAIAPSRSLGCSPLLSRVIGFDVNCNCCTSAVAFIILFLDCSLSKKLAATLSIPTCLPPPTQRRAPSWQPSSRFR